MVSFQCHACGDVVKKPKLDQHRSRCGSGFDCIDCSTTFNTPAEYKGHTQCISEAEKYQKSLYKGPKTNPGSVPRNNYPPSMNGSVLPRQFGGYGGRGRGGGRGGWGQPRTVATGANDTPLGTPARSPPTHTAISHSVPNGGDGAVKQSPAVVEVPRELSENKKRKAIAADVDESLRRTSKKTKVTEPEAIDPSSTSPLSSPVKVNVEKKSKRKKGEKKDEEGAAAEEQDDEERQRKKRRKDKKESKSGSDDAEKSAPSEEVGEKSRRKKKKAKDDTIAISGQDVEMKEANVDGKKKSKKDKKAKDSDTIAISSQDVEMKEVNVDGKKKSKRDKKEREASECSEAGLGATGTSKKSKRQEIELEGDGFQQEMRSMADDTTKEVDSRPKKEKRVKKNKDGKEQKKKSKRSSLGSVHAQ